MCGRKYDSEIAAREREAFLGRRNIAPQFRRAMQMLLEWTDKGQPSLNYDIRPTNEHAVICLDQDELSPRIMTWGFKPEWSNRLLFNSRSDKLKGRVWGKAFAQQRCVVPVGGFYEWTGPKAARQPHAIHHADGSTMFLGGLWLEQEGMPCYSLVTTAASDWMSRLHDRQPLMLRAHEVTDYLTDIDTAWRLVESGSPAELAQFACGPLSRTVPPAPLA